VSKTKGDIQRETFSIRLQPDLVPKLKHLAIEEKLTLSDLVEEGIILVLQSRGEDVTPFINARSKEKGKE